MSKAIGQTYDQEVKWSSSVMVFPSAFESSHSAVSSVVRWPFERDVKNRSVHLPKIEIMGIPFTTKEEDARIVLESDRWPSLRTSGGSVADAISEMRSLLADVIEEYVLCSEDQLSSDSREFRHYLISAMI